MHSTTTRSFTSSSSTRNIIHYRYRPSTSHASRALVCSSTLGNRTITATAVYGYARNTYWTRTTTRNKSTGLQQLESANRVAERITGA